MKFIYVHLIYLSIIAFLGYNYWSSVQAFKAFEQLNAQLNLDYEVMNNTASRIFKDIEKNAYAYRNPENQRNAARSEMAVKTTLNLTAFIDTNKAELIKTNGGLDTSNNHYLINGNSNTSFFIDAKIKEIKDKLSQFSNNLIDSIDDKRDKEELSKQYNLPKLIANKGYWQLLKTLPVSGALTELSCIQNKIKTDEISFLNYFEMRTGSTIMIFDSYKTAIAPKKAALIEGESFEADIYLAKYSSSPGSNVVIKVNGEPLEIKEGVAHFKSKNQTIGTKTIKAEAIIRNPLTGMTKTTEGSFEYQVLPKCSRDCQ
jgi:GldM N-terminal domain